MKHRVHRPLVGYLALTLGAGVTASIAACTTPHSTVESSNDELRNLEAQEVVGAIVLGQMSGPIEHSGQPRYRALKFEAEVGDVFDGWVRTPDGDAMAYLLRSDFKTIVANDDAEPTIKDAHVTATIDKSGTYYIAFREHDFEPATFTVDLRGSKLAEVSRADGGSAVPDGGAVSEAGPIPDCPTGPCKAATGWKALSSNTGQQLLAVWGTSASDVWAVGNGGVAVHYNGASWSVQAPPGAQSLQAISGTTSDNVYVADFAGAIFRFDGTSWSRTPWFGAGRAATGIFVDGPSTAWFSTVSSSTLSLARGTGLTVAPLQVATTGGSSEFSFNPFSVWASSPTDIWVTTNQLFHSDGTKLAIVPNVMATAVWSAGRSVFAVGNQSVSINAGGGVWTPSTTGTVGGLRGISGTSSNRVFVTATGANAQNKAANAGEVRAFNGTDWRNETLPAGTAGLNAVWAAPTGEVFAVGDLGTILQGP